MDDFRDKIVVLIFTSTSCPCSRLYIERLNELETTYYSKGVEIVAINSNARETLEEAKAFVAKHGIAYSFLRDNQAVYATRMGATRTPEVFLLDRDGCLRYHGRIDDSLNPRSVKRQDLKIALNEILAGKPVSKPTAKAFGCAITQDLPHTYTPD